MLNRTKVVFIFIHFFSPICLFSQIDSISFNFYSALNLKKGLTPALIASNNFNQLDIDCNRLIQGLEVHNIDNGKLFSLNYGINTFITEDYTVNIRLHEGYGESRLGFLKIWGGKREEIFGIHDTLLSTGSIIWSKNVRPMPKITLETNGFVYIPLTNNLIEFKALISHGWFNNNRYVKDILLHHKNLYFRFAERTNVAFTFGLEHFVMWGGKSPDPRFGDLPNDLSAFKSVFLGKGGDEGTVDASEVTNALGNHIGSINFDVRIKFHESSTIHLYKQHLIEDKSGLRFKNWEDGQWGMSLRLHQQKYLIKGINYEFINTTDQSIGGVYTGKYHEDSYFNSAAYVNGWTYYNKIIGTPLFTSGEYDSIAAINRFNVIKAHSIGFNGYLNKLKVIYIVKLAFIKNMGLLRYSYPPGVSRQFIAFAGCEYELNKDWTINTNIAFDIGEEFGNNIGIYMTVVYNPEFGRLKKGFKKD